MEICQDKKQKLICVKFGQKKKDKRNQLFTWGNLHSQPKPTLFLPPELENCVQNLCENRFSEAVLKKTCSFSITSCLLF